MIETFLLPLKWSFKMTFDYFENNYNMIQKSEEIRNVNMILIYIGKFLKKKIN